MRLEKELGLKKRTLIGFLSVLVLVAIAWSGSATEILYFPEPGCPACQRFGVFLEEMEGAYPDLTVERYEIQTFEAREILAKLLNAYEAELGPVPLLFIGDVAMVRDTFYGLSDEPIVLTEDEAKETIEGLIEDAIARQAPSPLERLAAMATEIVYVSAEACDECEAFEEALVAVVARYPGATVRHLLLGAEDADTTFAALKRLSAVVGDPPAVFVGDAVLIGNAIDQRAKPSRTFSSTEEALEALEGVIAIAVETEAASPLERLRLQKSVTLWAVVVAAALDSVNPCDFAVLILLLGTLLVIGRRGKVLWAGISFSAAIYVAYFLMGFLVYSILGMTIGTRNFRQPFILAVSGVAILVGLWQMKDLLWYGKFFSIEVPERWKPTVKKMTSAAVTIPGAFVAGLVDALFLAPCTSGPYLAILSLLSQTTGRMKGIALLLLYNLIFIIPLLLITAAVHFGFTTTARAERWRSGRLGKLHFVSGLVMVVLGIVMIIGVQLGYI